MNSVLEAMKKRRSRYALTNECSLSSEALHQLIADALTHAPTPMNAQTARLVVLLGENHRRFWDALLVRLKEVTDPEKFPKTKEKVETAFRAGFGTILFFEDTEAVQALKDKLPLYAHNFDSWSDQSNGMLQITLWSALAEANLGASLQHYQELMEDALKKEYDLPKPWRLLAQMPFGRATDVPEEKSIDPLSKRLFFFGE
ncbi:Nitroreductase family protein [Clostridiaceae bacterium JG1575]|nr:Nitroreductase family protein [Clostridiaceae bacterium JG1575]PKK40193.1 Nitroreductase family protein [Clostridiaceae bacterium JG1575]